MVDHEDAHVPVALEAGQVYTFDLAGGADYDTNANSVPTGELDTRLSLLDSNGAEVALDRSRGVTPGDERPVNTAERLPPALVAPVAAAPISSPFGP